MTSMLFTAPHSTLAVLAPAKQDVSSWQVSTKHGTQSGVGVNISGAGAYAKLSGRMTFQIRSLDKSKTFDQMKKSYSISGGVSGFWAWLGFGSNASTHKDEIHQVFKEVSNSQAVNGVADFDLEATGLYPNVQVFAQAFVMVMQVTDNLGNTYTMMSNGDPASDTGAQDANGTTLPSKGNNSTITL